MIEAKHNKFARLIFDFYLKRLLKKNFHSFNQIGNFPAINMNHPIIAIPNHFSWWDGFFIDFIKTTYFPKHKFFIIMLEKQLKKFWFFNKLGAIGFEPSNPKSLVKLKKYLDSIISKNNPPFIVFYPQGRIQSYDDNLVFKEGIKYLFSDNYDNTNFLMFAFKIQYLEDKKPDVFFSCKIIDDKEIIINIEKFTKIYNEFLEDFNKKAICSTISGKLF